jgi:hypothetical protein
VNCGLCKWYRHIDRDGAGVCHRYPPTQRAIGTTGQAAAEHPIVEAADYCGEFAERVKP